MVAGIRDHSQEGPKLRLRNKVVGKNDSGNLDRVSCGVLITARCTRVMFPKIKLTVKESKD